MGGVVNIITKKNMDEITGMAEIGSGSFATNFQKAAVGGGLSKRFDFDISARRYEQADNFKLGNGETRPHTRYKTQNGNIRVGANLGRSWRLDVSGDLYQGRDIETPGDIAYGDIQSGYKDIDRYGTDLMVGGELGVDNKAYLTVYRTQEKSDNYSNHVSGTAVPTYHNYDSEINWLGTQFKDEYSWYGHRFIAGIDYQDIDMESRSYNQNGSRKAPYSPDEGRENWAGYLETIWKFMDKRLTATAGGRYDTFKVETKPTPYKTGFTPNSENFSTFSPSAGLNYNFEQGIRLHTTIGKAFVPPTAGQLAGYAETVVGGVTMITKGNENLAPETSITYDLGIGYERRRMGFSLDITYFHTNVDDKITSVTIGNTTTYQNTLGSEMEGLETSLSFDIGAPINWDRSLSLFVNSTHMLKAKEEQTGGVMKDIHNVANYTLNYGIQYDDGMFNGKLHSRTQG
jgi:vitamin B12 transporter